MNTNIRRFAAVVTLTLVLGTPAIAKPNRDNVDRERAPIARLLRIIKRLVGVTPTQELVPPIPSPNVSNP